MSYYPSEANEIRKQFDRLFKLIEIMTVKIDIYNEYIEFKQIFNKLKNDFTELTNKCLTKYGKVFTHNHEVDTDEDLLDRVDYKITKMNTLEFETDDCYDLDTFIYRIRDRYLEAYNWWYERYGQVEGYFKEHN